jgi:hypothetical protein
MMPDSIKENQVRLRAEPAGGHFKELGVLQRQMGNAVLAMRFSSSGLQTSTILNESDLRFLSLDIKNVPC